MRNIFIQAGELTTQLVQSNSKEPISKETIVTSVVIPPIVTPPKLEIIDGIEEVFIKEEIASEDLPVVVGEVWREAYLGSPKLTQQTKYNSCRNPSLLTNKTYLAYANCAQNNLINFSEYFERVRVVKVVNARLYIRGNRTALQAGQTYIASQNTLKIQSNGGKVEVRWVAEIKVS